MTDLTIKDLEELENEKFMDMVRSIKGAKTNYYGHIDHFSNLLIPIAPFKVGDTVVIKSRKFKDKMARVNKVGFMGNPIMHDLAVSMRPSVHLTILKSDGSNSVYTHVLPFNLVEKLT